MAACFGGWSLDAPDVQSFSFVIPPLLVVWGITAAEACGVATVALVVLRRLDCRRGLDLLRPGSRQSSMELQACCKSWRTDKVVFSANCCGIAHTHATMLAEGVSLGNQTAYITFYPEVIHKERHHGLCQ